MRLNNKSNERMVVDEALVEIDKFVYLSTTLSKSEVAEEDIN